MKEVIELESKEVRIVIAKYFNIKIDDVIPNRYSYSIKGLPAEEIEKKLSTPN